MCFVNSFECVDLTSVLFAGHLLKTESEVFMFVQVFKVVRYDGRFIDVKSTSDFFINLNDVSLIASDPYDSVRCLLRTSDLSHDDNDTFDYSCYQLDVIKNHFSLI